MAWNDLTLSDKARMMQLAVRSGITDLKNIQEVYNKYAEGGQIDEDEYYGGELQAAVVTPKPVRITLTTDGFSKDTPITHSSLKAPGFWISKGSDDATYNLLTANCSDATGEVLSAIAGENLTRGITTPYGLAKKVSKVFKDYPGYYESFDGLDAHQTFEVPWYKYRIAKDIATKQRINSIVASARQRGASEEKINEIVANILEDAPLLNYELLPNGEVKRVSNSYAEGGPEEKTLYTVKWKKLPKSYQKGILQKAKEMNIPESEIPAWYESGRLNAALGPNGYPNSGRTRDNDSPTQEASEALENSMNGMVYDGANHRRPNMKYAIPYLEDKEIRVKGVGRVTTNALDSLAKYAAITDVPLEDALGIPAQETGFGAIPYYNYDSMIDGEKISSRALGNSSYFRNFGVIPAENFMRDFRYNKPDWKGEYISQDVPPLQHALEYWKAGKYNPGDPNHTEAVRKKGKQLMSDPNIQKWMKESKYVKKDKK